MKGASWHRPNDTLGVAAAVNGLSGIHRQFFAAGGLGILGGDGTLSYGLEEVTEAYYDFQVYKSLHCAVDYQFFNHPAFNRDRGPVSVFGLRLHWEF